MKILFFFAFLAVGCLDNPDDAVVIPEDDVDASDAQVDTSPDLGSDAESDTGQEALPPFMRGSIYEPGEYNVGYTSFETIYDAIDEPGRTIRLAVWYPTRDEEGEASRYANLLFRPDAFKDASLAPDGPYPLLVFSHGNTSLPEQSYFMTEFFTTHGFVVLAPEHTGNTWRDTEGGINLGSAPVRPQDVSAALDAFLDLPEADALAGQVTDQIAMTGHSFGGYTTLAVMGASFRVDPLLDLCASGQLDPSLCDSFSDAQIAAFRAGFNDERLKIGIPQTPAGALFFGTGLADIDRPMLMWTGGRDRTLPNQQEGDPIWRQLVGEQRRIDMVNAGHFTFSNMCELFGPVIEQVQNDGCNDTFIPYEEAFDIVNAYSLAFVRKQFGDTDEYDALLDGTETVFEAELDFQVKP